MTVGGLLNFFSRLLPKALWEIRTVPTFLYLHFKNVSLIEDRAGLQCKVREEE